MTRRPDVETSGLVLATLAVAVAAFVLGAPASAAADGNRACGLLSAAELQAVLGGRLSDLRAGAGTSPTSTADAAFCSAQTSNATVMLRLARRTGAAPDREAKGLAIVKQMGARIDVARIGPITCSTIVPPRNLEHYGFNTTCSVAKGTQVAAVEVTSKSLKDMVPIDRLRPLAERMAGRF